MALTSSVTHFPFRTPKGPFRAFCFHPVLTSMSTQVEETLVWRRTAGWFLKGLESHLLIGYGHSPPCLTFPPSALTLAACHLTSTLAFGSSVCSPSRRISSATWVVIKFFSPHPWLPREETDPAKSMWVLGSSQILGSQSPELMRKLGP